MDWTEIIKMALVGVFSGGAATWLTTIIRARAQNKRDVADAVNLEAEAKKKEAETESVQVSAYAALWEHVKKMGIDYEAKFTAMEEKYAAKLKAAEACYQAGIEEVQEQLLEDIRAKDIENKNLRGHIERLDAESKISNTHIARLNSESIAREKKYDALQAFTEGVIQSFMVLDSQLRANNLIPAASLPPKPKTGPLD